MQRIVILGTSGSGKTTLARTLAQRLTLPHIELDALHWGPNWTPAAPEVFHKRVADAVARPGWVLDGGYAGVRHLVIPRADTFIWLDYPMSLVFRRVFFRTMRRCWTQELLWNGCRERFATQLFTRDSLLLWVINTWRRRRRDYPRQLREQRMLGKQVIRLRTPSQTQRWLDGI